LVLKDSLVDAQWLRTAGHGSFGGAEVGECFAAARRIRHPDAESWFHASSGLGAAVVAGAEKSLANGRRASALGAYLRRTSSCDGACVIPPPAGASAADCGCTASKSRWPMCD